MLLTEDCNCELLCVVDESFLYIIEKIRCPRKFLRIIEE